MPQNVPTLLIGLGGIGSEVVEKVYMMIPKDRRDRIEVHAFDTNVYDIASRGHLGDFITQTSTNWTVGMYVKVAGDSILKWFPDDQPILLNKPMTNGAGMVRSVSRLAYREAMGKNKLAKLDTQIGNICQMAGAVAESGSRVVIVSSLAGGTGAGSFLQTALYLREKLKSAGTVLIRGVFLLPDVLIQTKTIKITEYEHVMANTYASMKELDAITRKASSRPEYDDGVDIELEYRPALPGDARGIQEHILTREHLPYDSCFLFDWENWRGENIRTFGNYKDQMASTIFLQLFSPLEGPGISSEDNLILQSIREDGLNRYCGAGVAVLRYPYEEMVEYCALRWAEESLANEWRRLDRDFEEELQQYQQDLKAGARAEKPQLEDRYAALFYDYAHQDIPDPFFSQLYRSTVITNDKGQDIGSKADRLISAVSELINKTLANDEDLNLAEAECRMDEGKLHKRDMAKREIEKMETSLEVLKNKIFKAIYEHRTKIVRQVIGQDCDAPEGVEGDDEFRLNAWMLRGPESQPLHPVAARYVLYRISAKLEALAKELAGKNKTYEDYIKRYDTIFDLPETEDIKEKVGDRIRIALKQRRPARWFKNTFKAFVEEYQLLSGDQLSRLMSYKVSKLTQAVYEQILKDIRKLQGVWEAYFRELKDVRYSLLHEINLRASEHEGLADPTVVTVLATKDHKEKIWEDLRVSLLVGGDLPADIRKRIYLGRFMQFCSERYPVDYGVSPKQEDIEEAFRKEVVGWCRDTVRPMARLELDVVSALRTEAAFAGLDPEEHLGARIVDLDQRAWPFIPEKPGVPAAQNYWGIHSDCLRMISPERQQELLANRATVIQDEADAFSRYEIIRYRAHYGLLASDFPKFSAGDQDPHAPQGPGSYFQSYMNRIQELITTGKTVTPHLDKRWHLPAYMPDLNPGIADAQRENMERAFVLGLIHERLRVEKVDGRWVWVYYGPQVHRPVVVEGKPVRGKYSELFGALSHNTEMVEEILRFAESKTKEDLDDMGDRKLLQHSFCVGCKSIPGSKPKASIFDAVFEFANEATGKDLQRTAETLLRRCIHEVEAYFVQVLGDHRENEARKEASELVVALRDKSKALGKSKGPKAATKKDDSQRVWNKLIDDYLAEMKAH